MDHRVEHGMNPTGRGEPGPGPTKSSGSGAGRSDGSEGRWRSTVGFRTDPGRVRDRNEDAYAVYLPYAGERNRAPVEGLFAVADGMGGHRAGDVASRYAAEAVQRAFGRPEEGAERAAPDPPIPDLSAWIRDLFGRINRQLSARDGSGKGRGMGSTLTLALLREGRLYLGHVGDSRCYRFRDGTLEQLTPDHSWVAEQRRAGLLSEEEARRHPNRNLLTQCLGLGRDLDLFLAEEALEDGTRYLLSSDGLHGPVPDPVMARVLDEEAEPQAAANRLVELALEAGAPDNVTAVVFDVRRGAPLGRTLPGAPEGAARLLALSGQRDAPAAAANGARRLRSAEAGSVRGPWSRALSRLRGALPSPRRHRLLVLAGGLLIAGGAGAGGWLLLRPSAAEETSVSPLEENAVPAPEEASPPEEAPPPAPPMDSSGPDPPGTSASTGMGEEGR